ncbi:lectin like domain-containing protein [Clostridium oryzae]|uniref:Papain family cysteine protease n=1 Tax=Clostridium oryzae TaxID=1450648 RepID=A0A1V4IC77_9CLOT|nr:lectin like domain-containing protein [Clostridium oryzae]OPJ57556.1 papain family cysteine protease [Clostridium oryzae]
MSDPKFTALPKNKDFLDYLESIKQGNVLSSTESKHSLGSVPPVVELPKYQVKQDQNAEFPSYYDLRSEGRVTPVKNQNPLGTCWAFATFGSLESNLLPNEFTDLSENNLINNHGFDWTVDQGGNHVLSSAYLTRWSGPMDEKDDPYAGQVHPSPSDIYPIKHIQEIRLLPARQNYTDNDYIKNVLVNYGAIHASMLWDDNYYDENSNAYYYNIAGTGTNHAVTIIGWDNNFSSSYFSITPPGDGAFIIENSWGTDWGSNGYFYISYYDERFVPRAAYTIAESTNNYKDIYQYDQFGFINSLGYTDSRSIWMANMFTAISDNPLTAVSFYTLYPSTECTIEVYTNCQDLPASGQLAATKSFTSNMIGYQTVKLDSPLAIANGTKFSIVVNLTVPAGYTSYAAVEEKIEGFSSNVTINPGESFLSSDKVSWFDLSQQPPYGNVCLKAFTEYIPTAAIVSFEPLTKIVTKLPTSEYSDNFIIKVIIKSLPSGQNVLGFHDTVSFDANLLQAVGCEIPSDCLLNPIIGEPIIDINNLSGTIDFNLARSDTAYPSSDGVVFNITLKAKDNGTASLSHSIADLRDDQGNPILVSAENCSIDIISSFIGDFNYDGKIDFEDLLLFAKAWNHKTGDIGWENATAGLYGTPYKEKDIGPATGTPPDLNVTPDNIVDLKDYLVFVEMWKWIWRS